MPHVPHIHSPRCDAPRGSPCRFGAFPKHFVLPKGIPSKQTAATTTLEVAAFQGWEKTSLDVASPLPIGAGII